VAESGPPTTPLRITDELHKLARMAGGCTVREARGLWFDPLGVAVAEPVAEVEFLCDPSTGFGWSEYQDQAQAVVRALIDAGETAVLVRGDRALFNLYNKEGVL
jgi:hypothetical protein